MRLEQRTMRVLAFLMREEGVTAEAVERAVASARDMELGRSVTLHGDDVAAMRRAFLLEQINLLTRA